MIRRAAVGLLLFALQAAALGAERRSSCGNSQLFLDDHWIARMDNVKRVVQRPVKHPANPVVRMDQSWEKRLVQTYGTVLFDEAKQLYRMWYLAGEANRELPDVPEGPVTAEYFQCYAESPDGINWTKPLVGQERFGTHERHNIVIPDGHGWSVLHEPNDPNPFRKFKGGGGRKFGFSRDGIEWDVLSWDESVGKNDTGTSIVKWNDEYLAYVRYQIKDPEWPAVMRAVGLSTSCDFETWTPKELLFTTDEEDGYPWVQPYGLSVTAYGDQLIGLYWVLYLDHEPGNNMIGPIKLQLVVSRDGRKWTRVADRQIFMEGDPCEWDGGSVQASTTLLVKDDTIRIYYTGHEVLHGITRKKTGVGLATLPMDRFVALQPAGDGSPGLLETRPAVPAGKDLLLNADVKEQADLQVELLDGQGKVIPGFDKARARLSRVDDLRWRVRWKHPLRDRGIADAARGKAVSVRLLLRGGSVFSIQTCNS